MKRIMSGILAFSLMFSFAVMPVMGKTSKMEKLVKSKEEELEIAKFLNQYGELRYSGVDRSYGEFDLSNPDQDVLGSFISGLLHYHPDILPNEELVRGEDDTERRKFKSEDVNKKVMALFGVSFDVNNWETEEGYFHMSLAQDAPSQAVTHIKNMYSLDGGLIYMNIEVLHICGPGQEECNKNTLYRDLPASIQKGFYDRAPYNVIIKENIKNGKKSYELIRYTPEPLTDKQLLEYSRAQVPLILVNGKELEVSAVKKDDRVLVPLRAIFEALDAEVVYDGPTKTITGTQGDTVIKLTVNKKEVMVGNNKILLDVPAQIINSSTLVPVRFIGESLGAEVVWEDNTVIINSKK